MTAGWMLYCIALSLLFGVGAAALERALHAFGRPVRWAWAGAVLLSLALPPALHFAPRGVETPPFVAAEVAPGIGEATLEAVPAPPTGTLERLDALLLPAWGAATLLLLLALGAAAARMQLRRRGWRRGRVAGVPVRISARTGPAVVGCAPGEIVLPEWTLSLEEERRRLIVEHEREHLRARDPALLLAGLAAAVLTPWNPALWWQLRRLRLAAEVDCDARVLRRRPDVRGYGLLLLDVGRYASTGRLAVAALSEPRSFLERRIRMMTSRPRRTLRPVALAVLACAAAVLSAAALPLPEQPQLRLSAADGPPAAPAPALHDTIYDVADVEGKPKLKNPADVQALLNSLYPPLLRHAGITGTVLVAMTVSREGQVTEAQVKEAPHEALGVAAVQAVRQMEFTPATKDARPVAVRVTLPVTFSLEKREGA